MTETVRIAQCLDILKKLYHCKQKVDCNQTTFIRLCERSKPFHILLRIIINSATELESSAPTTVEIPSDSAIENLLMVLKSILDFSTRFNRNADIDTPHLVFRNAYIPELMEFNTRLDQCALELSLMTQVSIEEHRKQEVEDVREFFSRTTESIVKAIREDEHILQSDKQAMLKELQLDIQTTWDKIRLVGTNLSLSLQDCEITVQQCFKLARDYDDYLTTICSMVRLEKRENSDVDLLIIEKIQNDSTNNVLNKEDELAWKTKNLNELKIKIDEVAVTTTKIGQGSFGQVNIGYYHNNKVAVKHIGNRNYSFSDIENELLIMKYLGVYPTLLACYGYTQSEASIYYVLLELSPFGALSDILYNHDAVSDIPITLKLAWLCDLSDALSYMHSKNVKHRDVKAQNLLVFNMFHIKLCNFGFTKEYHAGVNNATCSGVGTMAFMAPEVIRGLGSTFASDVYSFAMTAVQMLSRRPPPAHHDVKNQISSILMEDTQLSSLARLLWECVCQERELRPSSEEVHERCLNILEENGSDPRKIGHEMYNTISVLTQSVLSTEEATSGRISVITLNSDEAVKLLIYLGCCTDLGTKVSLAEITINGEALTNIDSVEILQTLERDDTPIRKPILEVVLKKLKEMIKNGLKQDVLNKIRQIVLYSEITDDSIYQAVHHWFTNRKLTIAMYGHISTWNTSKVTTMKNLFREKEIFNDDISGWDVSHVTNMSDMFYGASNFNQRLRNWDVSKVTNMSNMFSSASSFNQPLNNWNVGKVTDMSNMFSNAFSFNQPLDHWNVSNVTDMSGMFNNAFRFNQPLTSWNVSESTNIKNMFDNATSFNQSFHHWNVSKSPNKKHSISFSY